VSPLFPYLYKDTGEKEKRKERKEKEKGAKEEQK